MFSVIWVIIAVLWATIFLVMLYSNRKQKGIIVKKILDIKTEHDQRDYWFKKHNNLRERVLHVASEVKDIEIGWNKKEMGTHTACNKLTAIIAKMANDEFRDQYIFSVTEMKEKHVQEAKERIVQDKLDAARKKANEIERKTSNV